MAKPQICPQKYWKVYTHTQNSAWTDILKSGNILFVFYISFWLFTLSIAIDNLSIINNTICANIANVVNIALRNKFVGLSFLVFLLCEYIVQTKSKKPIHSILYPRRSVKAGKVSLFFILTI